MVFEAIKCNWADRLDLRLLCYGWRYLPVVVWCGGHVCTMRDISEIGGIFGNIGVDNCKTQCGT